MKDKKLVLFDLDGVILDSKINMSLSWEIVRNEHKVPIPFEKYFELIGRPFQEIMELLGLQDRSEDIESTYVEASIRNADKLMFYSGAYEVLISLSQSGYRLGIVTSKDSERARQVIEKLGVKFSTVQTPNDECRGKPAPDHLLMAMAKTNTDPKETVYVGDMSVDHDAAFRAGIDYLHAKWGYFPELDASVLKLDSWKDLGKLFQEGVAK